MERERILNLISKSGFKNIAILFSGAFLAQLITFSFQPLITRLYSPEDFGVLSLILSIVSICTPILTLQYQMGIVSAKSDKEANTVVALNSIILIIMVSFISIVLILYNLIYPETFKTAGKWIYIVIPLLLFTGFEKVVDAYNNRFEQYKLMSSIALVRSATSNILKLILGLFKFGVVGLIISQFLSIIFGIRRQSRYMISKKDEIFNTSISELIKVAIKYKVQPLISMPGIFVTLASFSVLPILISTLYDVEETGYFYLTMTVLGIPLTLISNNVGKVFFRKATLEYQLKGSFESTFVSISFLLTVIAFTGFSILWFIAEPLFSILFGKEWLRSGTFAKILIPQFVARFIVSGVMTGFIISGKQLLKLILQILFLVGLVVVYLITVKLNLSIEVFLNLINYTYLIIFLILFVVLYFTSKSRM